MVAPHFRAGRQAERFARRWLMRQGLAVVARNYRCRFGEIDLVMLEQQCLVIVEVRYRQSTGYGGALGSVSAEKRNRIMRTTSDFIRKHPCYRHQPLRFDVLSLSGDLNMPEIVWRQRAFSTDP
jgi:putative endonuclease